MSEGREGKLVVLTTPDRVRVVIAFPEPVTQIEFTEQHAREFAELVLKHADVCAARRALERGAVH